MTVPMLWRGTHETCSVGYCVATDAALIRVVEREFVHMRRRSTWRPHALGCRCRLYLCRKAHEAAGITVAPPLPWPMDCSLCGAAGFRDVAAAGFCVVHYAAFMEPIRARVVDQEGVACVGRLAGVVRPEYGVLVAELACTVCAASWVGVLGEACTWCADRPGLLLAEQRRILLRGPDLDASETAIAAFGDRLETAVAAGIIDRADAARVWSRAVQRVA